MVWEVMRVETTVELIDADTYRVLSGADRDRANMAVERELRRLQHLQLSYVHATDVSKS